MFAEVEKSMCYNASSSMEGDMRKAVIEIGNYTVKEAPNGGWRIFEAGEVISIHADKAGAIAAAKRLTTDR
jgi:hypothetical protein